MKLKPILWVLTIILVYMASFIPVYAGQSSSSTQTASVYIPPTTATTMTSEEDTTSKLVSLLLFGDNEVYTQNIKFTNPSNEDTEVWIKAEGYDTQTGKSFKIDGVNYKVQGTDKKGELTDSYRRAGVISRPKQGSSRSLPSLNLQIEMTSKTVPENSEAKIYFVTLRSNSLIPA